MKTGMTIQQLGDEVARIEASKRDLLVDTRSLMLSTSEQLEVGRGNESMLTVVGLEDEFQVLDHAHKQIAEVGKIPLPFYRRLQSSYPDVLDTTVNRILHTEHAERMIRTIDGKARALLSSKYRRRDNYDLLGAVVPPLTEILGGSLDGHVESADLTETNLWLTVVFPMFEEEIRVGDPVRLGVRIRNSEVGEGSTAVETLLWRLVCKNGMVSPGHALRAAHVGRRQTAEEDFSIYSDETLALDDAAFFAKVTDAVRACANEARFQQIVSAMRGLAAMRVDADPPKAVEILAAKNGLSEEERVSVLSHLIDGGDRSVWGYCNAVTRAAQDVESYGRSMELERIGGRLATPDFEKMLVA